MSPASNNNNDAFLERIFHRLDINGDGRVSPKELELFIKTVDEELAFTDIEDLTTSVDIDGDGFLSLEEFIEFVNKKVGNAEEEEKELTEAFRVYEMEGEGCITAGSLKQALSKLGTSKSINECMAMIQRFDINGDGVLSFDEFRVMLL